MERHEQSNRPPYQFWNIRKAKSRFGDITPSPSVLAPVLIAAITPHAKDTSGHAQWLLVLISIHLAVTLGLAKAFRVESNLQDGLRPPELKSVADLTDLFITP